MSRRSRLTLRILFSTLAATLGSDRAEAADKIFDPAVLHEVRFTLPAEDWANLKQNYLLNDFYQAAVEIDGESAGLVGIRSRGSGTRNPVKPGIKISFDKFVNKQTFHGLKNIDLKNLWADESMLREYLSLQVYDAMGIPTPAASMAHLVVNGEDYGVFTMMEDLDKTWLTERFGENSGDFFSYQWVDHWNFAYRGDAKDEYFPAPFEAETNTDTFNPEPMMDLDFVANFSDNARLLDEVAPYLDVTKFMDFIAAEEALGERDGFLGDLGMNNFYAYERAGTTQFNLVPWDRDDCLRDWDRPTDQGVKDNVLASRLLAMPELSARFSARVAEAAQRYVNPAWLGARLDTGYRLVREAALMDTKKHFTNEDFEAGVVGLRGVIAARASSLGWKADGTTPMSLSSIASLSQGMRLPSTGPGGESGRDQE